jgi:accessory gene regulator protein AgrB
MIMAPQLDVAQHILIETLLKEEFETKLIASEAVEQILLLPVSYCLVPRRRRHCLIVGAVACE